MTVSISHRTRFNLLCHFLSIIDICSSYRIKFKRKHLFWYVKFPWIRWWFQILSKERYEKRPGSFVCICCILIKGPYSVILAEKRNILLFEVKLQEYWRITNKNYSKTDNASNYHFRNYFTEILEELSSLQSKPLP